MKHQSAKKYSRLTQKKIATPVFDTMNRLMTWVLSWMHAASEDAQVVARQDTPCR